MHTDSLDFLSLIVSYETSRILRAYRVQLAFRLDADQRLLPLRSRVANSRFTFLTIVFWNKLNANRAIRKLSSLILERWIFIFTTFFSFYSIFLQDASSHQVANGNLKQYLHLKYHQLSQCVKALKSFLHDRDCVHGFQDWSLSLYNDSLSLYIWRTILFVPCLYSINGSLRAWCKREARFWLSEPTTSHNLGSFN